MKNLLLSAAIGDIAGSAYESRYNSTKNYDAVEMFSSHARFTDDTVCTFACAEALLNNLDMADNLWKRTNGHPHAGYGYRFRLWMAVSASSHVWDASISELVMIAVKISLTASFPSTGSISLLS